MAAFRAIDLRYSARARSQLLAIQAYVSEHDPAAATRVGAAIRDAAEILRYFPFAGRIGTSIGTREWVVRGLPYVIVYEIDGSQPSEVMVLGVFHGAQDRPADE